MSDQQQQDQQQEQQQRPFRFVVWHKTPFGQRLCVAGSAPELGGWSTPRAMTYERAAPEAGYHEWSLSTGLSGGPLAAHEYKYVVAWGEGPQQHYEWERCPNRRAGVSETEARDVFDSPELCVYPAGQRIARKTMFPKKVNPDGSFREYRGNTVICPLDTLGPQFELLCRAQELIRQDEAIRGLHAVLPQPSLHMTLFQLMSGAAPEPWDAANAKMKQAVGPAIARTAWAPGSVRMRVTGLYGNHYLTLEPADEASAQRLASAREAISQASGIPLKPYQFHIALALPMYDIGPAQEDASQRIWSEQNAIIAGLGEIALPPPVFVVFNDMTEFRPL
eukprot:m51a1_g4427 hypothetical protein (335) ;mRNA; r:61438-62651